MKPETELRNLRRDAKQVREQARRDAIANREQFKELNQRIRDLEAEKAALKKDNGRLEEIAELSRRLAGD